MTSAAAAAAFIMTGAAALYLLPSFIAVARRAPGAGGTIALNVLFGWSGLGWCIAMVRAFALHASECQPQVFNTLIIGSPPYPAGVAHIVEASTELAGRDR